MSPIFQTEALTLKPMDEPPSAQNVYLYSKSGRDFQWEGVLNCPRILFGDSPALPQGS